MSVRGAVLLSLLALAGCDRRPEIQKALPASAKDVAVARAEAPGSPEGDATLTVTARFPDAARCQVFIDAYAPHEKLARVGDGWSRDDPGHELRTLRCDGPQMKYEAVLY